MSVTADLGTFSVWQLLTDGMDLYFEAELRADQLELVATPELAGIVPFRWSLRIEEPIRS